ncbi:MAG: hypothetical protein QOI20_3283 [Acidimicrobiaceae bacterium]|jgi:hypothetical protein|nr:hypothetical protein [Acidimicrobiaceae bacterium]
MGFGSQLSKQKPAGTLKFTLDTITLGFDKNPVLELAYAGKGNGPYMSMLLKLANDQSKKLGSGRLTEAKIEASRQHTAELFAATVVKGWEFVAEDDSPGVPCPFSREKCLELLLSLASERDDIFDGLAAAARDADNFPTLAADPNAGTELGKK